jgi:hypothetical protein
MLGFQGTGGTGFIDQAVMMRFTSSREKVAGRGELAPAFSLP